MLKTSRAYFCQTVVEGSPWGRITSNLIGQARQSIEALFKRPVRTDGVIVKQPVPQQYRNRAWGGGLISQIHSNSRGALTKFAERNHTSDLVNAMKKRYAWRNAFRGGMWGQKLSTFAFVGVGVAAGAQWHVDHENFSVQDHINILELFGKKTNFEVQEPETILIERNLPDQLEFEFDLCLTEHTEHDSSDSSEPSFVLLSNLTFEDDDVRSTEEQYAKVTSEEDFVVQNNISKTSGSEISSFRITSEEEQILSEQLQKGLLRVEEQRVELSRMRASVEHLSEMLLELLRPSATVSSIITIEPSLLDIDLGEGHDMKVRLMRTLAVIGQQQLQLSVLRQQLSAMNQQLHQTYQAATGRPVIVRNSFTKRDACCGPGTTLQM